MQRISSMSSGAIGMVVSGAGALGVDDGVAAANISYRIECGLLQATHIDGAEFKPVAPPLPRDLSELFHAPTSALLAAATSAPAALTTMPIAPELIDEILCIARHTRTA